MHFVQTTRLPSAWRLRRIRLAMATGASIAVLLTGGCQTEDAANVYAPPPPPEVIVAMPVQQEVVRYLTFTGTIEASEVVEIRARVEGFLARIGFEPGQLVKKGDVLFEIDSRQYEAAVAKAQAEVQAKEAALAGAESDAQLAERLAKQSAGSKIDAIIKAARRDVIKADLISAQADLAQAQLDLGYCTITAPIDGRITRNEVDFGNLVGREEPTLLATVVNVDPVFVSLDASENDVLEVMRDRRDSGGAGTVQRGQVSPGNWRPSELALAGETDFKAKGRVNYVAPQMNAQTGTLRVRTQYDNADGALLPGLFAQVRFAMSSGKAMLVPEAALLSDQQGRFALIVNDKDEVETRRVRIGTLDGTLRVVEEGLEADDRVVVLGVLKARPGSKVTPKTQEPAATGS